VTVLDSGELAVDGDGSPKPVDPVVGEAERSEIRTPVPAPRTTSARHRGGMASTRAATVSVDRGTARATVTFGSWMSRHGDDAITRSATAALKIDATNE
jgi:hypothetical protein